MNREALVETAKIICEGDTFKAQLLLDLISGIIELDKEEEKKLKSVKDTGCLWHIKEKCWVDMPDSIHECNGKCSNFTDRNKYNKKY